MPDPAIPRNAHLVLVAGAMNPSIHHPAWYRSLGAIDDDELGASLKAVTGATTPVVSQFQFGSPILTVTCQPNIWMIQSTEDSSWARMLKIASLVFAKALKPSMTAYGLMVQRHLDTECEAKSFLADRIFSLHLGLPVGKSVNSQITLADNGEGVTITTSLQSSVFGQHVVFGLYHYDHPTGEIESILDGRADKFLADSAFFFANIVAAVNAGGTKGNDHG
jgi:hypothetical protein